MPALTQSFLIDLESRMQQITENEYGRLLKNQWWQNVATLRGSESKKEHLYWLIDSAKIERPNAAHGGGQAIFEDILSKKTEYENLNATAGLKLKREKFEDLDGNGVQLAAHWSRGMGAYAAYWPQKMVAEALRANPDTYDGLSFFNAAHPVNPFFPTYGTFANVFTGAASGAYPGAVPIDASVTPDVALANLQKVIAYIAQIKMPNGEDPRGLRLSKIIHPPALTARAQQLTNAKFLAQAATAGGGAADVEAIIANQGLGTPIQADELAAAFGGSDTSYYVVAEEVGTSELGAFTYLEREAFSILYHGEIDDAQLARKSELQWLTRGRNVVGAGHPYLLFRCDGT